MKILITLVFLANILTVNAQQVSIKNITPHPRLLLKDGEQKDINSAIESSSELSVVNNFIVKQCDECLTEPPVTYIKEGKRLLTISRKALQRIYYLSYGYRITGDLRYAKRAEEEMLAVCLFEDWNPSHFLDVGEMAMGVAIGYDWLYDVLSPECRRHIEKGLFDKAFTPAFKPQWFYNASNNWNSVCNAGLVFAALAVCESYPEESKKIIETALESNPKAMKCFGVEGGYPEGPTYWGYGTSFQVHLIAALESALGTDYGLSHSVEGFMKSAKFMNFMCAPSGKYFSFSDSKPNGRLNVVMPWFALKSGDSDIMWLDKKRLNSNELENNTTQRLLPTLMIYASKIGFDGLTPPKDKFWYNGGEVPLFVYRSGWRSPKDCYLAIKGGSPKTNHAHMDAGSFVFERDGVRWAVDLGMQEYYEIEKRGIGLWNTSQDGDRWRIYRLNNLSHNTLTINNERHRVESYAEIVETFTSPKKIGATVDITSTFGGALKRSIRSVLLDKKEDLLIVDTLETTDNPAEVMWCMVTTANAKIIDKRVIELTKDGKRLYMVVDSDQDAELKVWSNNPPEEYDAPNPGTMKVGVVLNIPKSTSTTLKVSLVSKMPK